MSAPEVHLSVMHVVSPMPCTWSGSNNNDSRTGALGQVHNFVLHVCPAHLRCQLGLSTVQTLGYDNVARSFSASKRAVPGAVWILPSTRHKAE